MAKAKWVKKTHNAIRQIMVCQTVVFMYIYTYMKATEAGRNNNNNNSNELALS